MSDVADPASPKVAQGTPLAIIYNPAAGTRRGINLEALVAGVGQPCAIWQTAGPGDAERLARSAVREGYAIVCAAGGDGTVNEVARGLLGSASALAIIPLGSGNGLARHLGIPTDPGKSVKGLKGGHVIQMDVGVLNDQEFFCTAGIGFDAVVSRNFATSRVRGFLSYLYTTMVSYRGYTPVQAEVTLSGKRHAGEFFLIAFANASQYGNGAYIAPQARIDDGRLDICLLPGRTALKSLRTAMALMTKRLHQMEPQAYHQTSGASVRCMRDVPYHIDGDYAGVARDFSITIKPGRLRVFLPQSSYRTL